MSGTQSRPRVAIACLLLAAFAASPAVAARSRLGTATRAPARCRPRPAASVRTSPITIDAGNPGRVVVRTRLLRRPRGRVGFAYWPASDCFGSRRLTGARLVRSGSGERLLATLRPVRAGRSYRVVVFERSGTSVAYGAPHAFIASSRSAVARTTLPKLGAPAPVTGAPAVTTAPTAGGSAAGPTAGGSTTAGATTLLWGAQIGSQFTGTQAPWDMNAVHDFASLVGKAPSLVAFNLPFENCASQCYWYSFPAKQLDAVRQYGALTLLNWSSMVSPISEDQPDFTLAELASGQFDTYIHTFAEGAKAWGHPLFLRFDWEMNGNWFPWGVLANGNQPQEFVAAWRHVHDIFTSVGTTNVTWVWCPNIVGPNTYANLATLYPGSAYVDWTCMDGYNYGGLRTPATWQSFTSVFGATYAAITKLAPNKPVMIGETSSSERGGSKASWISALFASLPASFPSVRALLWFDAYDGSDDWPLESSASATAAFSAGIAQSVFTSNSFSAAAQSPIAAP